MEVESGEEVEPDEAEPQVEVGRHCSYQTPCGDLSRCYIYLYKIAISTTSFYLYVYKCSCTQTNSIYLCEQSVYKHDTLLYCIYMQFTCTIEICRLHIPNQPGWNINYIRHYHRLPFLGIASLEQEEEPLLHALSLDIVLWKIILPSSLSSASYRVSLGVPASHIPY